MPLAPESREITATLSGRFEWLQMPFGLKSAAITFQRMIKTLYSDMLGKDIYTYLDDLIICIKNGDNQLANLEAVLLKGREPELKAKLIKCEFLKAKIIFLGHSVDGNGIHTMNYKSSTIENFPQPCTFENAHSLIGLIGYHRPFIHEFAKIPSS